MLMTPSSPQRARKLETCLVSLDDVRSSVSAISGVDGVIEGRQNPFLARAIIVCNEGTDSRPLPRRRNFSTLVSQVSFMDPQPTQHSALSKVNAGNPSVQGNVAVPQDATAASKLEQDSCSCSPTMMPTDMTNVPQRLYGYEMLDREASRENEKQTDGSSSTDVVRLLSRSENLCVRHQRMADEGANARLQKVRCKCLAPR